jgi:hypothetical protein
MKTPALSEDAAKRASSRKLLRGWHDAATITEAIEKPSKAGNDMIELTVVVQDGAGEERTLRDWLTATPLGALKLRHAAEAIGALDRYDAGEISQEDFPGHVVRVKIGIQKRRGYPDQNQIEDYAPAASAAVVALRAGGER